MYVRFLIERQTEKQIRNKGAGAPQIKRYDKNRINKLP